MYSPNQFPHLQLDLTELGLLALALLPDGAGVIAVRNKHQTVVQAFNRQAPRSRLVDPYPATDLRFATGHVRYVNAKVH
ncbi:hypothetical protein [Xenorhabdus sp. BG5]|uniref:hypothetical protein n=1 Tax=Xenorhabdus sp. BG5 TaxID=2782014 RepID=UPI00187E360E|nr:hypothetical protein [Xenorhabdus sp. BG5]MBE8597724.1 hypothetical protein [Xenorhabdus sp. BG5]